MFSFGGSYTAETLRQAGRTIEGFKGTTGYLLLMDLADELVKGAEARLDRDPTKFTAQDATYIATVRQTVATMREHYEFIIQEAAKAAYE